MRTLRWRAAVAATAVVVAALPLVASATTPALRCRVSGASGGWQRIPVEAFAPIEGVASSDTVSGYSLARTAPQHVVATNGKRLKVSDTSGCAWADGLTLGLQPTSDVPVTGTTASIVATAVLPGGRVLAAVRDGAGAASRPHVLTSDDGRTGYRAEDSGLPPQGSPQLLVAADDGRTVYLTLDLSSLGGGLLPDLPDVDSPTTGAKTGVLYASTDGGHTWELRTSVLDLPDGGGGVDRLVVDRFNANRLFAISNGLLLSSIDGGRTFSRVRVKDDNNVEDVTAIESAGGFVIGFTASGRALISPDGRAFYSVAAPPGVTSAAFRGDGRIAVEVKGALSVLDLERTQTNAVTGVRVEPGSLMGDAGPQATYHALSGHALLRYADPPPQDPLSAPVAIGDLGVPPPPPGTITPGSRTIQLKVGDSTVADYTLALPKSPTPLDLMFLIDSSGSMTSLIENLKQNINKVVRTVERAGINLNVGVATLGTGPEEGQAVPPYVNPTDPSDRGPKLYERFRKIGPPNPDFGAALGRVEPKQPQGDAQSEAQLAALEQATAGLGIRDPRSPQNAPLFLVEPGQGAEWRQAPGIRRVIVHATDEAFAKPVGSPMKNGRLDFQHTIDLLNKYDVKQIGLTQGSSESQPDLAKIARGTRTFAPPGGANCGQDVILPAGAPLVCTTEGDFSAIIGELVRSMVDRQPVRLLVRGGAPKVIRSLDATNLRSVDVTVPNTLPFKVGVSCAGRSAGRYTEEVVATLRDSKVASTRLTVECLGPAAAAALIPPAAAAAPPPGQRPPLPAPLAVLPAPGGVQPQIPQSQPQAQAQVNPMTAAAMQEQEQVELALALQEEEASQLDKDEELAMVGARRPDDSAAIALLATAMAASAGLGLARLRRRPEPALVRVRARR